MGSKVPRERSPALPVRRFEISPFLRLSCDRGLPLDGRCSTEDCERAWQRENAVQRSGCEIDLVSERPSLVRGELDRIRFGHCGRDRRERLNNLQMRLGRLNSDDYIDASGDSGEARVSGHT